MSDTKENILKIALHLFAVNGYEAVSVSMIAEALGMTKEHYINIIKISKIFLTVS